MWDRSNDHGSMSRRCTMELYFAPTRKKGIYLTRLKQSANTDKRIISRAQTIIYPTDRIDLWEMQ